MEARRAKAFDAAVLKDLRRGWYLGGAAFQRQLLERMEGHLGEHHAGELRRESAEQKAERIVTEELTRLGWRQCLLNALVLLRKASSAVFVHSLCKTQYFRRMPRDQFDFLRHGQRRRSDNGAAHGGAKSLPLGRQSS